ncbi:peroxiredoxin [Aquimarina pacifica]|uniref:peroxiredoxin n=1 Tax=Aquimarina pacifica TaxID=1296415 RepID=UPI00046F5131|nr:peroxiredoxin [Aquimarina pacifica]
MGLDVGDKVPVFSAISDTGETFNSQEVIGKKPVVVYFYPKNFTPGCTKEACGFRDSYADFQHLGAEVIGISLDGAKSHTRFKNKYSLPFLFLSDPKGGLRKIFGVKPGLLGLLPGRETFVIDADGIVQLKFNSMNASSHIRMAIAKMKEIIGE